MPYAKLTYSDGTFVVVHTHRSNNFPYNSGYLRVESEDGSWDLSGVWNTPDWQNEWVYIFLRHDKIKEFGGKVFKFNNTIHEVDKFGLIKNVEPCTRRFYHENKGNLAEPMKNSFIIRDSQKSKVYKSETFLHGDSKLNDNEVEEFILEVMCSEAWENLDVNFKRYQGHDVNISLNPRAKAYATGGINSITLPDWAKRKGIVIHELAHVAMGRLFDYSDRREKRIQVHGKEYCFVYLYLMHHFLPEKTQLLIERFDDWEVKYLTEMKEFDLSLPLTPEQVVV